ncbi:acetyl/propionyl/methylcrotonyl-CoA carboxylase subunit alpha [Nocardioides hwasunensis]|uniref:ATP-grasp domain-containing protein n=1 Tax=Nocardioides hwasunensis TaxID=397258 RepID=A0ABR8MLE2_9ACTN|nr:biotin carboxylase N-terminal domain-containing protein [Nocardioides hwasunensis]MBD3916390.1 ATP-grasp domain-containing protein [Nocardioides hwasunensis]
MNTLLIANRGEIALRVMRTAARLGWSTVAIHTDLDVDAPHVRAADRAVRVESYLDIDAVVAAARESGAGYVHPGYGFLSERAPFARALAEAGITLVGPSGDVMDAMGRKDAAREVAVAAGVPVVPSYSLDDDPATFDYPVLVKAAAGGGGKGMRVVHRIGDYAEALAAAQREARSSFGDDTMLVEKYVESGRHIEVQVMGDTHGTVLHFFERDCSTQRRHQKVLEEAPAPTITAAQQAAITASAVALAEQCGYTGAGTVEFLLDNASGEFYFLEMNTRLQVEHPVTEEVVRVASDQGRERVDLVELQLLVATGEPLPFGQDALTLEGHAIEARVYAEDSFNGFLPQAGVATHVAWPGEEGVRVDHALESGQEVSTSYDPMLGKVVAWGPDRESARNALVEALGRTEIAGLTTNTGFLRTLVASEEFRVEAIDTAWLDRNDVPAPDDTEARQLAAAALVPAGAAGPWQADGWRSGADPAPVRVEVGGELVDVPTQPAPGFVGVTSAAVEVVLRGQRFVFTRPDPFADAAAAAGDGTLLAPMPGTVLAVNVAEGQEVAEGETLGVMEAMKMELALTSPFAGTVTSVAPSVGDLVKLGAVLFVVEPASAG